MLCAAGAGVYSAFAAVCAQAGVHAAPSKGLKDACGWGTGVSLEEVALCGAERKEQMYFSSRFPDNCRTECKTMS